MTLTEIYKSRAQYVRGLGFKVTKDERICWVAIDKPNHAGYFLQGDDADKFLDGYWTVWNKAEDLSIEDAYYGQAYDYLD